MFPLAADPLRGEFWIRADLMEIVSPGENVRETGELSQREENALNLLLEDARWAFSGMIYGYSVRWTPPSRDRAVDEELEIEPLALISRGDPRMKTVSIVREHGFIYIQLEYTPDATQEKRLSGWGSQAFPAAGGSGRVPIGINSRREAVEVAVRDTLHSWLREREYNRPREIRGRVAFTAFPLTGLTGGFFRAEVSLRMDLEPVRPYAID